VFEPFVAYVAQRLADDRHVWATTLFDEVVELGYAGSYPSFTRALRSRALRLPCPACAAGLNRESAVIDHPPGEETQLDWLELPDPPASWGLEGICSSHLFFVVNRRLVVDEADTHVIALAESLRRAERAADQDVRGRVAVGLRRLAPSATGDLLPVTRMHGGSTWSAAWFERPDEPGIVLGTVDQVGSRLLFRGYGVSDRRLSVDAALVGTDSLIM